MINTSPWYLCACAPPRPAARRPVHDGRQPKPLALAEMSVMQTSAGSAQEAMPAEIKAMKEVVMVIHEVAHSAYPFPFRPFQRPATCRAKKKKSQPTFSHLTFSLRQVG